MSYLYIQLKHIVLFQALLILSIASLSADEAWTELSPLGNDGIRNAIGVSIGSSGYVKVEQIEGEHFVDDLWKYDPATDQWTRKADFPGERRLRATGFSVGGKFYYGLGESESGSYLGDFWQYDPVNDSWTRLDDFDGQPRRSPVSFDIDGKGYIGTGFSGGRLRDFWEYDPTNDSWTMKASLPGSRREVATGFSLNGKGYIGTGFIGGGSFTDDFWEYDPNNDEWIAIAPFGGSERVTAIGFTADGHAYVGTGHEGSGSSADPSNFTTDFWKYDPDNDQWTEHFDFPGLARNWPYAFSMDGIGYVGGGRIDGGATNDFWRFDPAVEVEPVNLAPQTVSSAQQSITAGNIIDVQYSVQNVGTNYIGGPWKDGIYLSETPELDGNETKLQKISNNFDLDINESYQRNVSALVPEELSGNFYLLINTDDAREIQFEDTTDNVLAASQQITVNPAPRADLEVTSISVPASAGSGEKVKIEWTIENVGDAPTEDIWTDYLFASPDKSALETDYKDDPDLFESLFITKVDAPQGLIPNESYTSSATVTLPMRYSGERYYKIISDRTENINQLQDNNQLVSDMLQVQQTPLPNLVIEDFSIQNNVFSDNYATYTYTVKNDGSASTLDDSWTDRLVITGYHPDDFEREIRFPLFGGIITVNTSTHRKVEIEHTGGLDPGETYTVTDSVHVGNCLLDTFNVWVDINYQEETFELSRNENRSLPHDSLFVVIEPKPDLVVNQVQNETAAPATGQSIQINYEVENDGFDIASNPLPPGGWVDRIFISNVDSFNPDHATSLGSHHYDDDLATGQTYDVTLSRFSLPDSAVGLHYLYVYTDYDNDICEVPNEDNNITRSEPFNVTLTPPADLVIDETDHINDQVAGNNLSFNYTVKNQGSGITNNNAWTDRIQMVHEDSSADAAFRVGQYNHESPLGAGESYEKQIAFQIPVSLESGNYQVFVETDKENDVFEYGILDNNIAYSNVFHIGRDLSRVSDLSVESFSYSGDLKTGEKITIDYEVKNLSKATLTNSWKDKIVLVNRHDVVVQEKEINVLNNLDSAASYNKSVEFILPEGRSGDFDLKVIADHKELVTEYNLSNNIKEEQVKIELSPSPDLIVSQIDYPSQANAGQPVQIAWTVTNDDEGSIEDGQSWRDQVYLSKHPVVTSNSIKLDFSDISGPLHQNETYDDTVLARLPNHIEGEYYVLVKTDDHEIIYEHKNDDNNVLASSSRMIITRPAPSDLKPVQSKIDFDGQYLTYEVENLSNNPAVGSWTDVIYLSEDPEWSSRDMKLDELTISEQELQENETYQKTIEPDLPLVKEGEYHFIIKADAFNYIPETDIENNTQASDSYHLDLIPELVMDSVYQESFSFSNFEKPYQVNRPADKGMIVELLPESDFLGTELFHRKWDMPDRNTHDHRHNNPNRPDQQILVPSEDHSVNDYLLAIAGGAVVTEPYEIVAHSAEYSVFDISPDHGGEFGNVSVNIRGFDFEDSMKFMLIRESDTIKAFESYVRSTNSADVHFDLRGQNRGFYDVVAVNSSGEEARLENGFEVTPEGFFKPFAEVSQPTLERPGNDFTVQVNYGNSGTVNQYDSWVVVAFFNEELTTDQYKVSYTGSSLDLDFEGSENLNPAEDSTFYESGGVTYFIYWAPLLAAQSEGDLSFNVRTSMDMQDETIYTYAFVAPRPISKYTITGRWDDISESATFYELAATMQAVSSVGGPGKNSMSGFGCSGKNNTNLDCDDVLNHEKMTPRLMENIQDFAGKVNPNLGGGKTVVDKIKDLFGPSGVDASDVAEAGIRSYAEGNCFEGAVDAAIDEVKDGLTPGAPDIPYSGPINDIFDCIDPDPDPPNDDKCCRTIQHPEYGELLRPAINPGDGCQDYCCDPVDCNDPDPPRNGGGGGGGTNIFNPIDPNEIVGPAGITDMRFIEKDEKLIYTIYFENLPSQQVPAQEVIIENPLQEDFRLQNFQLLEFGFGDLKFELPPVSSIDRTYELGPEYDNDHLRLVGGLNVAANEAFWRFTTINPATGGQITNPAGGFLPPNDSTGTGEGFVKYAIKLDPDANAGLELNNQAKIFFDNEAPIETNVWSNIVADSDPYSFVKELPEFQDTTRFLVEWDGHDGIPFGPGIRGFNIYYSKDGGEYNLWKERTLQRDAIFEGEMGSTYRFFSRLRTNDGTFEGPPAEYEAITTLDDNTRIRDDEELHDAPEPDHNIALELQPNPARKSSEVIITLPYAQKATVEVHTLTGNHIKTLHKGYLESGSSTLLLTLDGQLAEPGLYIVTLQTGTRRISGKLVVY